MIIYSGGTYIRGTTNYLDGKVVPKTEQSGDNTSRTRVIEIHSGVVYDVEEKGFLPSQLKTKGFHKDIESLFSEMEIVETCKPK